MSTVRGRASLIYETICPLSSPYLILRRCLTCSTSRDSIMSAIHQRSSMYWRNVSFAIVPLGPDDRVVTERLNALSNPTRLAIFALPGQRDQCVCHLIESLGLKQIMVSHHVGIHRRSGLVTPWPHPSDRRWLFYQLDRTALREIADVLGWLLDDADYNPVPMPCPADEARGARP